MPLKNPALYTDFYELTMAQGFFLTGRKNDTATFDYFFRRLPFKGGYVLFAGISDFLGLIQAFRFGPEELEYLASKGFESDFLDYLKTFSFSGNIHSVKEGEIVFPNEPIVRVEGNLIETQIIETLLLNLLNFESLVATKASRIRQASGDKVVLDFGLRRSQGYGGIQATKASIIGGLDGTSNVYAAMQHSLDVSGTMAHSWIQSFENELTAFQKYAEHYPDSCVLLVDTYSTLESGIPNAITVAKELEKRGSRLKAVRLDSGDLAYLSKQARQQLDSASLEYVQIAVSNQLDEYLIKSLLEQKAPIDIFGVGTKLTTAYDYPALDGVYKLSSINNEPKLKVSENVEKITLPGAKNVTRFFDENGDFYADALSLINEETVSEIQHPHFPVKRTTVKGLQSVNLLHPVVINGTIVIQASSAKESAGYASTQLSKLGDEYKRFDNPHVYKVGITKQLKDLRDHLLNSQNS